MNKQNLMRLTPIPSDKFFYDPTTRTFSTEASDLNGHQFLHQIYKDACDVGFVMLSSRTGNEVTYYLEKEEREESAYYLGGMPTEKCAVTCWAFRPTPESVSEHREAVNTKVVIFND